MEGERFHMNAYMCSNVLLKNAWKVSFSRFVNV